MEEEMVKSIEELLERYFEGETSAAEEQRIRAFFASGKIPEHLKAYKPLFAYFDEEIERRSVPIRTKSRRRIVLYTLSGVAACVLVLLSLTRLLNPADPCFCSDNYVVINGHCYTDIHTVRSLAAEALQEVAAPATDYFPDQEEEEAGRRIMDDQLKELGSLFDEGE